MPYGSNYRDMKMGQMQKPSPLQQRKMASQLGEAPRPKRMQPYKRPTGKVSMSNWAKYL